MATRHNRRFAITERRQKVTELYLEGWSQSAIATELNIAQSTVSDDIQHVRRKWEQSALQNYDELRSLADQKLQHIEHEAWAGWRRSQKPAQSAVVSGEGVAQQSRKSMKNQYGDPRFLDLVNKCIAQRRALLGLDVLPATAPMEGQENELVSLDERRERVLTLFTAFGHRERISQVGAAIDGDQPRGICTGDQPGTLEIGPAPDVAGSSDH